jgi:ribosomal protein S18 acetylase RimI-like enzyme
MMAFTSVPSAVPMRFAEAADAPEVAALIRTMDAHYRPGDVLPSADEYVVMVAAALREKEGSRFALARGTDGEPLGVACVAVIRPGRDLAGLVYLKDLFVMEKARGRGIGRQLMRFLARFAMDNRIGRMDFTTDASNEAAQRFYASLGARLQEKVCFTLPTKQLLNLASEKAD